MLFLFAKSVLVGFLLSVLVLIGPIGMLSIKNTLDFGFKSGISIAIGTLSADLFFGFLAAGGLVFVSQFIMSHMHLLQIFSGIILFIFGAISIANSRKEQTKEATINQEGFVKTAVQVFFLTFTNPAPIFLFMGVIAFLGGKNVTHIDAIIIVFAAILGSLIWWIGLVGLVAKIRHTVSKRFIKIIRVLSGVLLILFGLFAIVDVLFLKKGH